MKAQLPRITGVILALGALRALAADPVLPPSSDWGTTEVRWEHQGQRLLGRAKGGECAFPGDLPIIQASWEGDVLVGTVRVCQQGSGCAERALPLFAFFNPDDGTLTAHVRLDPGCQSPLVSEEGRLSLVPHADAPKKGEISTVSHRELKKKLPTHLEKAQDNLDRMKGREAFLEFSRALDGGEDRFKGYLGRGEAEMMLGRTRAAVRDYNKALALKPDAVAYYNLACAQSRLGMLSEGLESLRHAVRYGFADRMKLTRDPDLAPVRALHGFEQVLASVDAQTGR